MPTMSTQWKILLYRTSQGVSPVKDFIDKLELKAQAKVRNSVKLLGDFGTGLGPPNIKKLTGTELWELRILGVDSIRVLYVAVTGRAFLLLHGFKKKKNKIPSKEIKIAIKRLTDYKART